MSNGPMAVPLEDQLKRALEDYEDIATKAHSWSSVVPHALREYFARRIKERDASPMTVKARVDYRDSRHVGVTIFDKSGSGDTFANCGRLIMSPEGVEALKLVMTVDE